MIRNTSDRVPLEKSVYLHFRTRTRAYAGTRNRTRAWSDCERIVFETSTSAISLNMSTKSREMLTGRLREQYRETHLCAIFCTLMSSCDFARPTCLYFLPLERNLRQASP